ncbi:MAG: peptide deformylase [Candidatus Peribacteraceae bacterium]|nr:peptide deformylase [Candidatus Peribacteraceae bacterium]MDD5074531.1 peptide deformylase [Candidatus Peribacteraceae bacterium]
MTALPVITGAQNPILRRKTAKVPKVTKAIQKLIADMRETVKHEDGAGLAAPQVGESLSLCLAMIDGKMTVLINPKILRKGKETDRQEEGCLSLPGLTVVVERPVDITLKFTDEKGKEQERRLLDYNARVAQHEIDHLEGRLIIDYSSTPLRP